MQNPYECYPVLKLNTQISSITAFDSYLLVGTKQGHLIMYSVVSKILDQKFEVQLLRYHKNFYRKPIQQLSVISQFNILIILTDYMIYVHDVSSMNFPLISTLHKTKGATLFAIDVENQTDKSLTHKKSFIVRLCVSVKRKLMLFYWKRHEFLELRDDITVNDVPKSIAWCNSAICVGFKGEYILVYTDKTEQKELFPTGKNLEPNVIKLPDSMFALVKDSQSVFVNTEGNLLLKSVIKWSKDPQTLIYDEPYFIALLNDTIEIRSMPPTSLVQTISLASCQLLCRSSSGVLYVSTGFNIHRMQAMPVANQIKMLLEEKQFQLAIKLCNIIPDDPEEGRRNRYQIQTVYAYDLFHNKQYHESMKQFLELDTDINDVVRLFPNLLPQLLSNDTSSDTHSLKLSSSDMEKSYLALIEYLTEARLRLLINKKNISESEKTVQLQTIDTTLLKCYLRTNDAVIAPLLRLNNCHVEESEKVLKKHKKYSELIILYHTKGLHRKALELLEKQADQPDSPLRGHKRTIQYLQDLGKDHIDLIIQFSRWVLEKYEEDGLKIFIEDVSEIEPKVEQLPRQEIFNFLVKTKKSLVIPYLEHVINVWNDDNSTLHNALAHQYREKILELCNSKSPIDQLTCRNIKSKLILFLEKSIHYTPEKLLTYFPFDDLYEERIILLNKLGRHEQALAIYIIVLKNIEKAIDYCNRVYERGGVNANQVYLALFELLIKPPDNWLCGVTPPPEPPQPNIDSAIKILEDYATKISPIKILPILPNDTPIHRIKNYFVTSLRDLLNKKRKVQLLQELLHTERNQVQELKIRYESQNILLTELNVCAVCKKRFSSQSAFIRKPNGDVIHISCQDEEVK